MRMYMVPFSLVAVAAQQDFWEIVPATNKPIAIAGIALDNASIATDAGDAAEEFLGLTIVRGNTTSGSGGSTPTISPVDAIDTAAGFTAEINNTTVASTAGATIAAFGWNTRAPFREYFPLEMQPRCSAAESRICVRLVTTPTDTFNVSGTLWVVEGY